jgi:hypothetical protein
MEEDSISAASMVNVSNNPVATAPVKYSNRVFHRRLSGTPILFAEKAAEFPLRRPGDLQKFQDLLAQFPLPPIHEKPTATASTNQPTSTVGSWTSGLKGLASNLFSKHT